MLIKSSENATRWDLCNEILNKVRVLKGLPIRPKKENPFVKRG